MILLSKRYNRPTKSNGTKSEPKFFRNLKTYKCKWTCSTCETAPIEGKISFLKRGLHFGRQLLQKCLLMFSPFLHNLDLYESEIQDSDTDNESTGCPADDYGESDIEWEETDDDN